MQGRCWIAVGVVLAAMIVVSRPVRAEEQVETYPDGARQSVYTVTADGTRNGPFKEYHPNGKLKAAGSYRHGKRNGPYTERDPGGRIKLRATYRKGELTGAYLEFAEDGKPLRKAAYRNGKLHGAQQEFVDGALVKDEVWLDGQLLIPRSSGQIAAALTAIKKMPIESVGRPPEVGPAIKAVLQDPGLQAKREDAVRLLMGYRSICGLPYADIKLDWTYVAHAVAAAKMLARIGKLDHTPANPGMPEAEYRFAYKGTSCSNLSDGGSLVESVRMFMHDSDPGNIDRLGHRRWCLNPAMLKTGFGSSGGYTAMWSFDRSRGEIPDYDYVAFPPRGLCPSASFGDDYAWSISLNPEKYQCPVESAVKVQVVPARLNLRQATLEKASSPLAMNYFKVNTDGFGIANCIIFRPQGVRVAPGAAYWVRITGLSDASGAETSIEYLVAFIGL